MAACGPKADVGVVAWACDDEPDIKEPVQALSHWPPAGVVAGLR